MHGNGEIDFPIHTDCNDQKFGHETFENGLSTQARRWQRWAQVLATKISRVAAKVPKLNKAIVWFGQVKGNG